MPDYENIFNSISDVVSIHHANTGEVLFVNDSCMKVYGHPPCKLVKEGLSLVLPDDIAFSIQHAFEYLKLADRGEEQHFEMKARHADGHEFWIDVNLKSIVLDNVRRVMTIVRDITDKKTTISNLERSEQFQKTVNFFTSSLINKNSEETILQDVVEKSVEVFGFEDIVIYLINEKNKLEPKASSGNQGDGRPLLLSDIKPLSMGEGLVGDAAAKSKSIIVGDLSIDSRYIAHSRKRSSEISVSIIYQDEVMGVIDSEHSEKNFYTSLHLEILEAIASLAAIKLIQVRSEAQIRNNEERLRSILDSSPDLIFVLDGEAIYREIYTVNEDLLVAPSKQLIGKSINNFLDKKEVNVLKSAIKRVIKTKKSELVEYSRMKTNGDIGWFSVSIAYFKYQNKPATLLLSRDITDQRNAQLEIAESQKVLNSINQNASEGLFRSKSEGGLVYVNRAFVKMFGYSSVEEVMNLKSVDLYARSTGRSELTVKRKKEKNVSSAEVLFKRKDDSTFWGLTSYLLTTDQDGNAIFDGAIRDISVSKKNAEKLKELNNTLVEQNIKLASKEQELESFNKKLIANRDSLVNTLEELSDRNFELDQLVYRTSHDLRAPLRSVLGLVNLYKMEESPVHEYINKIEERIYKMDEFIKSMLDYSKASRLIVDHVEVDIEEMISDCLKDVEFLDGFDKVKVNIDVVKSKYHINTDALRLKIILSNIISNAIKYRNKHEDQSYVDIKVNVSDVETSIVIEDNGIGISEMYVDKVFDMFYRATDKSEGSGLGMYIVKQSINKLNGSITLDSEEGRGTMFKILIPNYS